MGINELALNAAASTLAQGLRQQNNLRTKMNLSQQELLQKKLLQDQAEEIQHRNLLEKEADARQRLAMQLQTQRQLEKQREDAALRRTQTEHKYRMNEDIAKYKRYGKQENFLRYLNYKRQSALKMILQGLGNTFQGIPSNPETVRKGMNELYEAKQLEKNYMKNILGENVYKKIYEDQPNPNTNSNPNVNSYNDPFAPFKGSSLDNSNIGKFFNGGR